jgi:uncharacterized protein (DUF983 family)
MAEPVGKNISDKELRAKHPLASKSGLTVFVGLLCATGALCPKCGWGTRRTSKRWARCKKCGERVARHDLKDVTVKRG